MEQLLSGERLGAGTVTEEDTAMYRLGKEATPSDGAQLAAFAEEAADEVLSAVVAADVAGPRWVVRVEDHIKNLPPDPEQASCISKQSMTEDLLRCPFSLLSNEHTQAYAICKRLLGMLIACSMAY